MAGKLINIHVIKQIIRIPQQGGSKQGISQHLKISRNKVKKYLHLIRIKQLGPEALLQMDDVLLEHLFIGPNASNPDRYDHLNVLFP